MARKNLSQNCMSGIKLSINRGLELSFEHPEIANKYESGSTLDELAREYNPLDYRLSHSVAINSIYYCLKRLLPNKKLRKIGKEHIRRSGVLNGKLTGSVNGRMNYDLGLGIASLKTEDFQKSGRNLAISRGYKLFEAETQKTKYGKVNENNILLS